MAESGKTAETPTPVVGCFLFYFLITQWVSRGDGNEIKTFIFSWLDIFLSFLAVVVSMLAYTETVSRDFGTFTAHYKQLTLWLY